MSKSFTMSLVFISYSPPINKNLIILYSHPKVLIRSSMEIPEALEKFKLYFKATFFFPLRLYHAISLVTEQFFLEFQQL